jgi:hexosaminidase
MDPALTTRSEVSKILMVIARKSYKSCLQRIAISCFPLVLLSLVLSASVWGQDAGSSPRLKLMPLPRSVKIESGALVLDSHFHAGIDSSHDVRLDQALGRFLERLDRECGGIRRAQADLAGSSANVLLLKVDGPGGAVQSVDEDESYRLAVTPTSALLTAATDVGAMHGMETFLQLITAQNGACQLPAVTIDDAPRFRWRGFMLDVSRHFEPVEVIKRTIDGMAIAKLNVFHWHLSDDQGFRAESRKLPRFTEAASNGMFYTQEQMREVVAYARARGIRVVPEFDMPGHTSSWLLAYPEIGAGEDIRALPTVFGIPQAELDPSNEKTFRFIETFVGEMSEIFPDTYFHIGGDETAGKGWLENPRIVEFMKKQDLKAPADLQAYFNRRLLPILAKHGKRMMGWDEIMNPALPKDILIQSWRGEASLSQGAEQGFAGILSAPYYLDAQKTAAEMFLADPLPTETKLNADQQKLVLGGEVCQWAEQIDPETVDSRVWPRTLAIAERFWSAQSDRDLEDMYRRLRMTSLELENVGLTHITGPEKLRRNLLESAHPEALDVMASVIEPASFSDRYQGQHTDALSSLDRLVDAVVPDPASREEIAREVDEVLMPGRTGDAKVAEIHLRRRFMAWQEAVPQIEAMAQRSPRLSDLQTRAMQLGELGTMGLDVLAYLDEHAGAPAGWKDAQIATIAAAEKPSALVRFVFLPALRKLVEAAATTSNQP